MKLNIANPPTGAQKLIEIDDERKLRIFYDKRLANEVNADALGDEFKGYIFKISGGYDKDGFPMKQGIFTPTRVRVLLRNGAKCFHGLRKGERRRKSVRGAIVGPDLSILNLVIVKKGEGELPGLTDKILPRRLGPKRASKLRKLFNLSKEDDVQKYAIRRVVPEHENKDGKKIKKRVRVAKVQRLLTPIKLQRIRRRKKLERERRLKSREEAAAYKKLVQQRLSVRSEQHNRELSVKRASSKRLSEKKDSQKKGAEEVKKAAKGDKEVKSVGKPAKGVKAPAKGAQVKVGKGPVKVPKPASKGDKSEEKKAGDKKAGDKKAGDKKAPAKAGAKVKAPEKGSQAKVGGAPAKKAAAKGGDKAEKPKSEGKAPSKAPAKEAKPASKADKPKSEGKAPSKAPAKEAKPAAKKAAPKK